MVTIIPIITVGLGLGLDPNPNPTVMIGIMSQDVSVTRAPPLCNRKDGEHKEKVCDLERSPADDQVR